MIKNLLIASVFALGCSSSLADTRPAPPVPTSDVLFEIAQQNKANVSLPQFDFQLLDDGRWTYIETFEQAIKMRGSGKLSPEKLATVRSELARAKWTITTADMTCMAYAAQYKQYSVGGAPVWREEMCSGQSLDATSSKHLANVMAIVTPILAGMVK